MQIYQTDISLFLQKKELMKVEFRHKTPLQKSIFSKKNRIEQVPPNVAIKRGRSNLSYFVTPNHLIESLLVTR